MSTLKQCEWRKHRLYLQKIREIAGGLFAQKDASIGTRQSGPDAKLKQIVEKFNYRKKDTKCSP